LSRELLSGELLEAALESSAGTDSDLSYQELERRISALEAELGKPDLLLVRYTWIAMRVAPF